GQRLRERLHIEEPALLDCARDRLGLVLANEIRDARVGHHHLDRGDPATVDAWEEALADDAAEDARHDRADHLLLLVGKELDYAADGLRRIDGVEGGEEEEGVAEDTFE